MKVTITPAVLKWAVRASGFSVDEVAAATGVTTEQFRAFIQGTERPTVSEARAIAAKLRRPLATLFLPSPPESVRPAVQFRHPVGTKGRDLNPGELKALRRAARIQKVASWAAREGGASKIDLPRYQIRQKPETVAGPARGILNAPSQETLANLTPAEALHTWRARLEQRGILVLFISVGENSLRGFSMWNDWTPMIVVNTSASPEARIFTLLHEAAHLLTRTDSACLGPSATFRQGGGDPTERWCEELAAAVLLPESMIADFITNTLRLAPGEMVSKLGDVSRLARAARASLRATAIRLIRAGRAKPSLYAAIPPTSDRRKPGGGGAGRTRLETRTDQLGERTARIFVGAVEQGTLIASDVMDYLNVSQRDVDTLVKQFAR